jgi:hypothetical protein
MKTLIPFCTAIVLSFLTTIIKAQEQTVQIDSSNYYDYYIDINRTSNGLTYAYNFKKSDKSLNLPLKDVHITTDWLRIQDVTPVIKEELKKAGFDDAFTHVLFKNDLGQRFIVSAYSRNA